MPFAGEPAADRADTFTLAVDYFDWFGSVLPRRLEGLPFEQQAASAVPTGWSALGLLKHSAATRRFWIRHVFAGEDVDFTWPGSPELEWQVTADDTAERITEFFRAEQAHAVDVLRRGDPKDVAARDFGTGVRPTLAWVLLHLLQESARHAGHLDISRELTDGTTHLD
ncbi:DinB family protein [Actinoplanes sp. GCM10030250]|uniref:DinB family protein n=1 Tax=Actinoplanes sp. GCM10030250 TaxID=3273376 RepID=UPI003609B689